MPRDVLKQIGEFMPQLAQASESPFDGMMLALTAAIAFAKEGGAPMDTLHRGVDMLWERVDVRVLDEPTSRAGRPD